jgi:hypothetical protein
MVILGGPQGSHVMVEMLLWEEVQVAGLRVRQQVEMVYGLEVVAAAAGSIISKPEWAETGA